MRPRRPHPVRPSWTRLLWRRARTLWLLKMAGTTLGIGLFFVLYAWTLHGTADRAVTLPLTWIDRWVGVSEIALLPYASLWLYLALAPAFAANAGALRAQAAGALAIASLGLASYWVFPTVTPAFDVDWARYPLLQFLKSSDPGGNAFPSLHVAFACYAALLIASQLASLGAPRWARHLNWLWCAAIVYSTLATRQHVFVDVLGGLALTRLALCLAWRRPARLRRRAAVPPVAENRGSVLHPSSPP
ncbi:membrane-associated phospholipid phosphatase [Variovorax sp. TBS-050B]|uniref:phosphatase PAP2 family protein n=1 Tax=Variovorax sp. TBS-050B TaxID=2940551 RepID=UPI002474C68B|nr:phosphatase PAP2 family protein [Variovorax sp. TBS-050B]MDH6590607.1 membrane-associated phospholipid phosphatase [Variovorax sp. TBS-050B]